MKLANIRALNRFADTIRSLDNEIEDLRPR
jgi:hypothetical protein